MKYRHALACTSILALGLVSCSSDDSAMQSPPATPIPAETIAESPNSIEPTTEEVQPTEEETEESKFGEQEKNERGNIVKSLGQLAGIVSGTGNNESLVEFSITAIEPNFECTSPYAAESENGNFVAITMDIQTTAALADEDWPQFSVSAYDFRVISPEGTRENDSVGNGYMCLEDSEEIPVNLGPGEHVTGKIVLDSAHSTGSLILTFGGATGWEWAF